MARSLPEKRVFPITTSQEDPVTDTKESSNSRRRRRKKRTQAKVHTLPTQEETATPSLQPSRPVLVAVGTDAGLFLFRSDLARGSWRLGRHLDPSSAFDRIVADPRDERTFLAATRRGGQPLLRISRDRGMSWNEPRKPPTLERPPGWTRGDYLDRFTALSPAHRNRPGEWLLGTARQGLFRSRDGGESWRRVSGLEHLALSWTALRGVKRDLAASEVVDILVDPLDHRHLFVAVRPGGVLESLDGGRTWCDRNDGVRPDAFLLQNLEYARDPQRLVMCRSHPGRLYLQARCGLFRLETGDDTWEHIGGGLPEKVGDIGRTLAVHPRDPETLWAFPMDAGEVLAPPVPRSRPEIYESVSGGGKWRKRSVGLPKRAWWNVAPPAFVTDHSDPTGLYLGTRTGQVWFSADAGRHWQALVVDLPPVRCLAVLEAPARSRSSRRRKPVAA